VAAKVVGGGEARLAMAMMVAIRSINTGAKMATDRGVEGEAKAKAKGEEGDENADAAGGIFFCTEKEQEQQKEGE
jgi:hypothetical protein